MNFQTTAIGMTGGAAIGYAMACLIPDAVTAIVLTVLLSLIWGFIVAEKFGD